MRLLEVVGAVTMVYLVVLAAAYGFMWVIAHHAGEQADAIADQLNRYATG